MLQNLTNSVKKISCNNGHQTAMSGSYKYVMLVYGQIGGVPSCAWATNHLGDRQKWATKQPGDSQLGDTLWPTGRQK